VKILVRDRITLYGVAAYMAAPQLKSAGWHRYTDYDAAPEGSVCVLIKVAYKPLQVDISTAMWA